MRILFAADGSEQAQLAAELLAGIAWPAGSSLRVITVLDRPSAMFGMPWATHRPAGADQLGEELAREAETILESSCRLLASTGARIERAVLHGRPASAIVGDGAEWAADLVVMGSRGRGSLASMLLGSVGAEVVDQAPCPVLVVRNRTINRIVLAHDGSSHARAGEELLTRWPIFARSAVEVASIAHVVVPWQSGIASPAYAEATAAWQEGRHASLQEHRQIAEDAVSRLSRAGISAGATVAEGSPATELIRIASERQADLIVIGTHGRTGLDRLFLGSVARTVLMHSPVSVLVARDRAVGRQGHVPSE